LWGYVQSRYGLSRQETLEKLAEMADYELPDITLYSRENAEKP